MVSQKLLLFITIISIILAYLSINGFIGFTNKLTNNKHKRSFIHTEEQIELTKIVRIMPKPCDYSQPMAIIIHSAAKYYQRRQIQRSTWVAQAKNYNINVYFALGITENLFEEQNIRKESEKYKDLIEFAFFDDYYNNTLKSISVLHWVQKHCNHSKFILKTDDDVIVNIQLILNNLDQFKQGIHGLLFTKVKVHQDRTSKWYLPRRYYHKEVYPAYNPGFAYLMSGNITDSLIKGIDSYLGYIIDIDDVFITGIISELMGIKRYYSRLFAKIYCFSYCSLYKFGVVFGCNKVNLLENLWFKWKNSTRDSCFPNKTKLIKN